uniref:hypothetical protein n=1 Tax=Clostridium sp. NkU-1 TaxID=1095009 RepID=UPI000B2D32D4
MFNTFQTGEESNFSWNMIGNIAEGRKNLGEEMPVMMYRLFQYSLRVNCQGDWAEKWQESFSEVQERFPEENLPCTCLI